MSRTSKPARPLTPADAARVDTARAEARARFAHHADDADEPAGAVDPDSPPMTDADLVALRPAAEVVPALVEASLRRKGGRPRLEAPRVAVSLRLDPDVVEALRASGEGWQSRVNATLRKSLKL